MSAEPTCDHPKSRGAIECKPCRSLRLNPPRTCEQCGGVFRRKGGKPKATDAMKFCSRNCAFEHAGYRRIARRATTLFQQAWGGRCDRCGVSQPIRRLRCDPCNKAVTREKAREYYLSTVDYDRTDVTCPECSKAFLQGHASQIYCDDVCGERAHRRNRRHRVRAQSTGRPVSMHEIYVRDGAKCQICGGKVKRTHNPREPLAGVIDHIVPVSRGGPHDPSNVQLAHRRCNEVKGVRAVGSQMRLAI